MHDSTVKTLVIVGGLAIGIMGIVALASTADDPTPTPKSNQVTPWPSPTQSSWMANHGISIVTPKPTLAKVYCTTTDVATGKLVVVSPGDRAVIGNSVSECQADGSWAPVGPAN